jgi:putative oxidoreductase
MNKSIDYLLLVGRILLAAIFISAAFGKISSPSGTIGYISHVGLPLPTVAYGIAVIVELVGGLALLVGFKTRWAATALAVFTVVAALAFHHDFGDQMQTIHFMKNLAIAGGFLYVIAFGAGTISVDQRMS